MLLESVRPERTGGLAAAVSEDGVAALVRGGEGPVRLFVPLVPVFDDLLALWLLLRTGPPLPAPTEQALTAYARVSRQGHSPGDGSPHTRPDAVLDEVRRSVGSLDVAGAPERLLERTAELFEHLAERLQHGASLDDDDLFATAPRFREEVELLRRDRGTWLEDRARAEVLQARLGERRADLLVLEEPASTRFREWARRDASAPGGGGFALLLVRWEGGEWVLSADPARRLSVASAAAALDEAEAAKRGGPPPACWYDGARHGGTLVASPHGGTELSRHEIISALRPVLGLQHLPSRPADRGRWPIGWAAVAAAALLLGLGVLLARPGPDEPVVEPTPTVPPLRGGSPLDAEAPEEPVSAASLYSERHALIVGIGDYRDDPQDLAYARRDAEAVRDLLSDGYHFDSVVELYDERATREEILKALVGFRGLPRDAALFVFWAGHGTTLLTPDGEPMGYLVPYDGSMASPGEIASRGISMSVIREQLDRMVGAKHKLMVVDACYGGLLATRGDKRAPVADLAYLRSIADEPVFQVLTAGQPDQRVLDGGPGGHSVFTGELLAALQPRAGGFVTGRELGVEVTRRVFEAADARGHEQTPDFGRVSGSGDFVFFAPSE